MKRTWWVIIGSAVIISGLVLSLWISWYAWEATRDGTNTNTDTNSNVSPNDPIPYDPSYGTTCPLGVKFLASKGGPTVDCECPDGYTKDSLMFGSSTGDACYGPGTECPMFSVTCISN